MYTTEVQELVTEMMYSLPTPELVRQPAIVAVEIEGKLYVLKSKFNTEDTKTMLENKEAFVRFDKKIYRRELLESLSAGEFFDKNIILAPAIMNSRGKTAFSKLRQLNSPEEPNTPIDPNKDSFINKVSFELGKIVGVVESSTLCSLDFIINESLENMVRLSEVSSDAFIEGVIAGGKEVGTELTQDEARKLYIQWRTNN